MNAGAGLCPALALRLCGGRLPITLLRRRPQRTLGPLLDGGIEQRVALAIPAVAFPPPGSRARPSSAGCTPGTPSGSDTPPPSRFPCSGNGTGFPPVRQPEPGRRIYPAPCRQCGGKGRGSRANDGAGFSLGRLPVLRMDFGLSVTDENHDRAVTARSQDQRKVTNGGPSTSSQ
jgi:hypothetical protein